MKNTILIIAITLISLTGFAQTSNVDQPEKVTKYVTTFPNGDEAITIIESSKSNVLKLTSADNFYKYEILELANHELVHKSNNKGKVCDIDKSKLEDGNYTLKVYTSDFVITSDITISNKNGEAIK
ncbi:MAG: hypothetical protein GQ552_04760, partial [Flavobacteriaceae bacterium]|nr:hypothetical protein [Flavobacteriaceae bacterium]